MIKISVIVPVYNLEDYIYTCYESIKNQTYNNWELIFINDGSTDGSYEILKKIEKNDSRVIVINSKNHGVSHARNLGLKKASGDYITFIDGDDYIDTNCFKSYADSIKKTNADILICKYYFKDSDKKQSFPLNAKTYEAEKILKEHLKFQLVSSLCFGIYKKEVINGIYLVEDIKSFEDWEYLFQILQNGNKVLIINNGFYHYVSRIGSASKSPFNKNHMTAFNIVEEVKRKISNKELYDEELQCLEANILLKIMVLYASRQKNKEQNYKLELKNIARRNFRKAIKNHALNLKQKFYIVIVCIEPNMFKLLSKIKNRSK